MVDLGLLQVCAILVIMFWLCEAGLWSGFTVVEHMTCATAYAQTCMCYWVLLQLPYMCIVVVAMVPMFCCWSPWHDAYWSKILLIVPSSADICGTSTSYNILKWQLC